MREEMRMYASDFAQVGANIQTQLNKRRMHIPGKQHNRSKGTACCSAPSGMMPHDNNSY